MTFTDYQLTNPHTHLDISLLFDNNNYTLIRLISFYIITPLVSSWTLSFLPLYIGTWPHPPILQSVTQNAELLNLSLSLILLEPV